MLRSGSEEMAQEVVKRARKERLIEANISHVASLTGSSGCLRFIDTGQLSLFCGQAGEEA